MTGVYVHTTVMMHTVITMKVVGHGEDDERKSERADAVARAVGWFERIEATCTRFDPRSELRRLSDNVGQPVPASPILFEVVRFALALAAESDGAFDPTVGFSMERRGFDREFRSGARVVTALDVPADISWRDVSVDAAARTITLHRPLVLDLGAVAKGFAIDMAARELAAFDRFAIDAGGDLCLRGVNEHGKPWSVGIRHPRADGIIETIRVSDAAVCTSGDYERRDAAGGHHILDPERAAPASLAASVTVIAPTAMAADGLATAAFVLGPRRGIELLERHGVRGVMYTPSLERVATHAA